MTARLSRTARRQIHPHGAARTCSTPCAVDRHPHHRQQHRRQPSRARRRPDSPARHGGGTPVRRGLNLQCTRHSRPPFPPSAAASPRPRSRPRECLHPERHRRTTLHRRFAMGKSPPPVGASGGSSSRRSAFTKALKRVRQKNAVHLPGNKAAKCITPRSGGGSKGRKSRKGTVYTRSSPGIVSDVFGCIEDECRLQLLKETGFLAFKHLNINKANKDFAAWLLSKFDPIYSSLRVGSRTQLKVTERDVHLILGIPFEGKPIVPATNQELVTLKKYICDLFEKPSFEQITLKFLITILYKRPLHPMSSKDVLKFKTALIWVVVTLFLAPVSLSNHISTRYMPALVDIENVQKYNRAKFVIDELKVAADSLHNKLKNGKGAGYINGCIILLQVFYLDNLDNGINTLQHTSFPRIGAYNDRIIDELIKKDMLIKNRLPFLSFGKLKLREGREVCYSHNASAIQAVVLMHTQSRLAQQIPEAFDHGSPPKVTSAFIGGIVAPSFDLGLSQLDNNNDTTESPPQRSSAWQFTSTA